MLVVVVGVGIGARRCDIVRSEALDRRRACCLVSLNALKEHKYRDLDRHLCMLDGEEASGFSCVF